MLRTSSTVGDENGGDNIRKTSSGIFSVESSLFGRCVSVTRGRRSALEDRTNQRNDGGESRLEASVISDVSTDPLQAGRRCLKEARDILAPANRPVPAPPPPPSVAMLAVDQGDFEDTQSAAEYAGDIVKHLRSQEMLLMPSKGYLAAHPEISERIRGVVVDWLVEVHVKFKLATNTLFLSVNLLDRYLSATRELKRGNLQLLAVACLLVASKYEDIYPPEVRDFIAGTDKAYSRDDILRMEVAVLNAVKFKVTVPSGFDFLQRYAKVMAVSQKQFNLTQYLLELTLVDYAFLKYTPSHIACASLLASSMICRNADVWPAVVVDHSGFTETVLRHCCDDILRVVQHVTEKPLQAVRKKFSSSKFGSVAKLVVPG